MNLCIFDFMNCFFSFETLENYYFTTPKTVLLVKAFAQEYFKRKSLHTHLHICVPCPLSRVVDFSPFPSNSGTVKSGLQKLAVANIIYL